MAESRFSVMALLARVSSPGVCRVTGKAKAPGNTPRPRRHTPSARVFLTASPYGPENAAATPGAVRAVSVMRPHTRALLSHEGTE